MIQAELSNFQNILGRKGIYLVRYQLNSAEKPLLMRKRHSIHAETFNKCVMFGENEFQLRSYRKTESPVVTPRAQHSTGHHCTPTGPGDWSPVPAPQPSELVVPIFSGAWVVTAGRHGRQTAAVPGFETQLGTARLDTSPRQTRNSACKGMTNEGWRVVPSL